MRILVVSRQFSEDVETMVHGVFKRFRMFLEAFQDIAQIDILYFVPPNVDTTPNAVSHFQIAVEKHFKVSIRLFLCPIEHAKNPGWKMMRHMGGTFSILKQPLYSRTAGPAQLKAIEACLDDKPDAVFVHRLASMIPFFLNSNKLPPIFFDLDDIEHIAFRRRLKYLPGVLSKFKNIMMYPALCFGEKRAIKLAQRTFVCSDHDLEYLSDKWGVDGLVKIPNAIPLPEKQEIIKEPNLLFIGSYSYKPNLDAANFLINKIWPFIKEKVPKAKLFIAGKSPENIPSYHIRTEGVIFTGFVKNIESLYQQTRIVCVPILSGSGTRVKIIEAAAYGKPIVSTSVGVEGLEMTDGINIIIRDDPKKFADECIELLNDHNRCVVIGSAGREFVSKTNNHDNIKEKIKQTIIQAHHKIDI